MATHHVPSWRLAVRTALSLALRTACTATWMAWGLCQLPARAAPTPPPAPAEAPVMIERVNPTRLFNGEGAPKGLEIRSLVTDDWSRTWVGMIYGIWIFDGSNFYAHRPPLPPEPHLRAPDVDWMRKDADFIYYPWGAGRVIRTHQKSGESEVASRQGWLTVKDAPASEDVAHRSIWCEQKEGFWSIPLHAQNAVRWTDVKSGRKTDLVFPVDAQVRRGVACFGDRLALLIDDSRLVVAERSSGDSLRLSRDIDLRPFGIKEAGKFHALKTLAMLDSVTALVYGSNGLYRIDLDLQTSTKIAADHLHPRLIAGATLQARPDASGHDIWVFSDTDVIYKLDDKSWTLSAINLMAPPDERKVDFARLMRRGSADYIWSGASEELALTSLGTQNIKLYRVNKQYKEGEYATQSTICLDGQHRGWYTNVMYDLFTFDAIQNDTSRVRKIAHRAGMFSQCDRDAGIWVSEADSFITHYWRDAQQRVQRRQYPLPSAIAGKAEIALADNDVVWLSAWDSIWTLDIQTGAYKRIHQFKGQQIRMADGDRRADIRLVVNTREGANTKKVTGIRADGQIIDLPPTPEESRQFRFRPGGDWMTISSTGAIFSLPTQPSVSSTWQKEYMPADQTHTFDRCVQIADDGTLWFVSSRALWSWRKGQSSPRKIPFEDVGSIGTSGEYTCARAATGRMTFAHSKGWIDLAPSHHGAPPALRPPRVSAWSNSATPWTLVFHEAPSLEMTENDSLLRLRLHVPGELDGASLQWRFRVVGLDHDWRPPQRSGEIELSGLPAHTYQVEAQASRDAMAWSPTGGIAFTIVPPWYRTTGAMASATLLLALYAAWRFREFKQLQRRRAVELRQLAEADRRVNLALWASGDVIWGMDLGTGQGHLTPVSWLVDDVNHCLQQGQLVGRWVHPQDLPRLHSTWRSLRRARSTECLLQFRMQGREKQWVWVEARGRVAEHETSQEGQRHISGSLRNISALRAAQDSLHHQAMHDPLTGLPNLRQWKSLVSQAVSTDQAFAIMMMDVDRFKYINDSLGHSFGDRVLIDIAARIADSLRAKVPGSVLARIAGDEYAALLPGTSTAAAEQAAAALVNEASRPLEIDGVEIVVTLSIGIACYPDHGLDHTNLHAAMDVALHQAKIQGRNGTATFNAEWRGGIVQRMHMETALQFALARQEFALVYQPKLDIATGQCHSAEALLRWRSDQWPSNNVETVIQILEGSHLIHDVGLWVVQEAARQLATWRKQGLMLSSIAVNVSSKQLARSGFAQSVAKIIADAGLSPSDLEVEITESVLIPDSASSHAQLKALHDLGVRLAIDDFGKGYSSLERLRSLPFDVLKIDKRFIDGIDVNDEHQRFCSHLITMMQEMGLKVVAEGVERQTQLDILTDIGADAAQGYLISRPINATRFMQEVGHGHALLN